MTPPPRERSWAGAFLVASVAIVTATPVIGTLPVTRRRGRRPGKADGHKSARRRRRRQHVRRGAGQAATAAERRVRPGEQRRSSGSEQWRPRSGSSVGWPAGGGEPGHEGRPPRSGAEPAGDRRGPGTRRWQGGDRRAGSPAAGVGPYAAASATGGTRERRRGRAGPTNGARAAGTGRAVVAAGGRQTHRPRRKPRRTGVGRRRHGRRRRRPKRAPPDVERRSVAGRRRSRARHAMAAADAYATTATGTRCGSSGRCASAARRRRASASSPGSPSTRSATTPRRRRSSRPSSSSPTRWTSTRAHGLLPGAEALARVDELWVELAAVSPTAELVDRGPHRATPARSPTGVACTRRSPCCASGPTA